MSRDYRIGMLWMEGPLSFLEQLCIVSFRDAGHHVVLYTYGDVTGIPDGIEVADAATVLPRHDFLQHERTGSPALHSDLFRYHLLAGNPDMIWADTDAYCVRKFETDSGHFHGWESDRHVNGGVLGLPADSETLQALLAFTRDEFAIPPWYDEQTRAEYAAKKERGEPVHAGEMAWGVWGPHALTHFLHETGEIRHALNRQALYPFSFKERRLMTRPGFDASGHVTPDTFSIHFYGRRMRRRLEEKFDSLPPPDSLIGRLVRKHGIDPLAARIPPKSAVQRSAGTDQAGTGSATDIATAVTERVPEPAMATAAASATAPPTVTRDPQAPAPGPTPAAPSVPPPEMRPDPSVNLTDLADRFGSDKGSKKHRYTELYNMLFLPYRHVPIRFLEMGLQIGGPEHGKHADRATTDAPSVRMWLEFFPKAEIYGLDVSDFGWFEDPRFRFIRCDMDRRENIRAATAALPDLDIIIDDASHASHHQQFGFLELFPKLRRGGLYVIEDLRWQPPAYERAGITTTANLFQSWLDARSFSHSDPTIAAEFNALAPEISGAFVFQAHFRKSKRDQVVVVHKR